MVIETDDLRIALGGRQILRGINLSLRKGEVVGLLGPNGAGKSTLMRALNGQVRGQGTVRVMGRDLAEMSLHDRARNIAYLAQDRLIAWQITVDRLVGLGRLPWRSRLGRGDPDDRRICGEAVDMMDIAHLLDRRATELSGGEQARVLVARAIAQDTPVLLADEPTSGLDPAHQFHLMAALRSLAGKGRCILVSVHDLTLAARWCDRVIVVDNGCVVAAGRPLDVMTPGLLDDVFGILARIETDECGLVLAPVGLSGDR